MWCVHIYKTHAHLPHVRVAKTYESLSNKPVLAQDFAPRVYFLPDVGSKFTRGVMSTFLAAASDLTSAYLAGGVYVLTGRDERHLREKTAFSAQFLSPYYERGKKSL